MFRYLIFDNVVCDIYRNVSQLWIRLGIRSTFSVLNAVNNLAKTAFTNVMANLIAVTITLKCLPPSAMVAIGPSWRITYPL